MDRAADILDIIATRKVGRRTVRAGDRRAHGCGDRGESRRQGRDPAGRHDLRRLDRRRLRARGGAQGRQGRARRWPLAPCFGAAARPARRSRRAGRRRAGRRALRQEHVPEPGHHGHFRRAGAAAAAGRDLRIEPGRRRGRRSGQAERALPSRSARRRPSSRPSPRPIAASKAMRCRSRRRARAMSWSRRKVAATKRRSAGGARGRCRLRRLRRQPQEGRRAEGGARADAAFPPSAWPSSRRRPASISARSRRTRSRSRSWRKSSRCGAAGIPGRRANVSQSGKSTELGERNAL